MAIEIKMSQVLYVTIVWLKLNLQILRCWMTCLSKTNAICDTFSQKIITWSTRNWPNLLFSSHFLELPEKKIVTHLATHLLLNQHVQSSQQLVKKMHLSRKGSSGRRSLLVSISLILTIILFSLCFTTVNSSAKGRMKICLKNCGQCKRIYGDYFEGRRCADSCILQKGRFIPDCHDDYSISDFISKLE